MNVVRYFPYLGPSRRSDVRVVELVLDRGATEAEGTPRRTRDILNMLIDGRVLKPGERFPTSKAPQDREMWFAFMLAQLALLFQQKTGHRVSHYKLPQLQRDTECIVLIEHEHCDVGMTAVKLAIELMNGTRKQLLEPFRQFSEFSRQRALSAETAALIQSAQNMDIPVSQLERQPYLQDASRRFCIRPNGLVRFGHGAESRVLDGSFCLHHAGDYQRALLRNPGLRQELLRKLDSRLTRPGDSSDRPEKNYEILAIGSKTFALASTDGEGFEWVENIHHDFCQLAFELQRGAGDQPMLIRLQSSSIGCEVGECSGEICDFKLAPDLAEFAARLARPGLLKDIADAMMAWLFPQPQLARMPVVAVTGTNGKTTTCRLIAHILSHAAYRPGLVSSDGVYLDGEEISKGDASAFVGHARVLSSPKVNAAVLESHHAGIAIRGFAFNNCDIGVCLNVTHDHIRSHEISSVEEMAAIKRAVPARASKCAIVFADNEHCRNMIPGLKSAEVGLVSLESDVEALRSLVAGKKACFCVLESVGDKEWLVLYDDTARFELIPVEEIPLTFGGTARFMISNTMHAVLATWRLGIATDLIATALQNFVPGKLMTPGRLNVFEDLPFRVIVDYAHNEDGMKNVSEFARRQSVQGRRILAFSGSARRPQESNRLCAYAVAGAFDRYFCMNYVELSDELDTTRFMRDCLIEKRVEPDAIGLTRHGKAAFFDVLKVCEPGDLLIILVGTKDLANFSDYLAEYADMKKFSNSGT